MQTKVLVIGRRMHYNLEHYTYNALKRLGVEVRFTGYASILNFKCMEFARMLATRSNVIREIFTPLWLKKVNEAYLKEMTAFRPDLLISLKGESLLPSTIKNARSNFGVKTCLWYPDDPRFFNSLAKHIAPHYDAVYTYSNKAIELYKSIGIDKVSRLPFACDSEIHRATEVERERNGRAVFIGTFSYKRYRFIRKLLKNGLPVDIIGPYWNRFIGKNVISDGVFGKDMADLFQRYSVCINLHQNLDYGPNMRTFEVTGSAGFLLTDNAEDISSFFLPGKEIETYNNASDATNKIKLAIKGEMDVDGISRNAYKRCHSEHTYDNRILTLLADAQL